MYKILEVLYQNGNLILKEKLSPTMEGKSLKVLLLENDDTGRKKEVFLNSVNKHSFKLPKNYQFNREEIYER